MTSCTCDGRPISGRPPQRPSVAAVEVGRRLGRYLPSVGLAVDSHKAPVFTRFDVTSGE